MRSGRRVSAARSWRAPAPPPVKRTLSGRDATVAAGNAVPSNRMAVSGRAAPSGGGGADGGTVGNEEAAIIVVFGFF